MYCFAVACALGIALLAYPATTVAGAHRDCTQLGGVSFAVRKVVLETRPHTTRAVDQRPRKSETKATRAGLRGSSTLRPARVVAPSPAVSPDAGQRAVPR